MGCWWSCDHRRTRLKWPSNGALTAPLGRTTRLLQPTGDRVRILGPLEAVDDGTLLQLGGAKQRALLAVLLLAASRVERPADRAALGRRAARDRDGFAPELHLAAAQGARPDDDRDAAARLRDRARAGAARPRARAAARREARGDPSRRARLLGDALALWRGRRSRSLPTRRSPRPSSRASRSSGSRVEERTEAELALGRHGELVGDLEALVREHPLRERLRGQLMLALYRTGRQADALCGIPRRTQNAGRGARDRAGAGASGGSTDRSSGRSAHSVRVAPPALEDHYDEGDAQVRFRAPVRPRGPSSALEVWGGRCRASSSPLLLVDTLRAGRRRPAVSRTSRRAVAARNGIGPLHDELHLALARDFEPSLLLHAGSPVSRRCSDAARCRSS